MQVGAFSGRAGIRAGLQERKKEKKGEGKGKGRRGEGEVGKRFGFVTPRGIVFGNYTRITRDACISLVFLFLFLFVRITTRCTSFPSSPFFFPLRLALNRSSFRSRSRILFSFSWRNGRRGIGLFSYGMT